MSDALAAVYRAREAWSRGSGSAERGKGFDGLVAHARAHVPYYRDLDANADELPLVDRSLYQADGSRFRDSRLDSAESYTLSSSGTTGSPLQVTLDEGTWYAVNYHFFAQVAELADLPLSDAPFQRGRPGVVFVSNKPGRQNFVRPLPSLDEALYVRLQLGEAAATARLFGKLAAPILYGKPTYLLDLRALLMSQGTETAPWRPRLLLVSGESLYADDGERLRSYFGAPIVNALASTEGGLIAATKPDSDTFSVFGENVRLEVLRADGTAGTRGSGEIVVSNLVNRGTVFIRYRSGDHAELATDPDTGTQRLTTLFGREPERLHVAGHEVSTAHVVERLRHVLGLLDYQVAGGRATEPGLLRWVPDPYGHQPEGVERELRTALRDLLPEGTVALERAIGITAPGGKKRRFIAGI